MRIKILNDNKILEKEREEFLKFFDITTENFKKEAHSFLESLYNFKSVFTYRPKGIGLINKICIYFVAFGFVYYFTLIISNYIDVIIHNYNVLNLLIIESIEFILQFIILIYVLYNNMLNDDNYKHECYIKLINSKIYQKYLNQLLKKANELNIEIEIIKDKDDENII